MWTAISRALRRRCPSCGRGKLFQGYLKQVDNCSHCDENLGAVRADDGPPWLTILLVGHIMAPVMVLANGQSKTPQYSVALGLMGLGLFLSLTILPFAKALFIAIIWKSKAGEDIPPALVQDPTDSQT